MSNTLTFLAAKISEPTVSREFVKIGIGKTMTW